MFKGASGFHAGVSNQEFITLVDEATITWDYQISSNAQVTLGASRILDTPTNVANGDYGTLKVIQDAIGGWGLTLPADFKVVNGGGGAVTLTPTGGAVDILAWSYDGTDFWLTVGPNFT